MTKNQIDTLGKRIDEVLFYVWDPIGVSEFPAARGEYSSYVETLIEDVLQLRLDAIEDKLNQIQAEDMGIHIRDLELNKRIAKQLVNYKAAIEDDLQ